MCIRDRSSDNQLKRPEVLATSTSASMSGSIGRTSSIKLRKLSPTNSPMTSIRANARTMPMAMVKAKLAVEKKNSNKLFS